ncbi:hypothetical protein M9H77_16541 [Catharanthus roseus]|uniref:Uncharacterized protein n=1 Tax=Catharanthus roseus TaxID=4058 RepID=A0ACC0B225_CATRO|nr:hypothetical protein M9H77_16541 [Catharanthus roseus]
MGQNNNHCKRKLALLWMLYPWLPCCPTPPSSDFISFCLPPAHSNVIYLLFQSKSHNGTTHHCFQKDWSRKGNHWDIYPPGPSLHLTTTSWCGLQHIRFIREYALLATPFSVMTLLLHVALTYYDYLDKLSLKISLQKSIISNIGYLEFAKKVRVKRLRLDVIELLSMISLGNQKKLTIRPFSHE